MKKIVLIILVTLFILIVPLARTLQGSEDIGAYFESGDTARILEMLAADPGLLRADMGSGMTPLHYGVYYGYVPVVDYALKNGVELNLKDNRGLTPVWFSVSGGRPAMLRKLIELGADLSVRNSEGENMLFRAVRAGNAEVVGLLLDHGFKVEDQSPNGMTILDYALNSGSLDVLKLLQARGVRLESRPEAALSNLHRAVLSRKADVVHYLLDHGADVNAKNRTGQTPLLLAVDFDNPDGARGLLMRGADPNAADQDGLTPLLMAVKKGNTDLIGLLLDKGARPDAADPRTGKTPLHEAALRGRAGVVETLLARGTEKNARDKEGRTALACALEHGNQTSAAVLRKNGAAEAEGAPVFDNAALLGKSLGKGEATVWYLRHSGWAVKTKSAFLVFDYWDNDPAPDEKTLANGHVDPEALKGLPVYVFASHEHGDHFDPQVLEWKKVLPDITYVFGFEPPAGEGIVSLAPRVQKTVGPLAVTTIEANDAGVGFAVQVDGLTIFHAGDHSNNILEAAGNDFFPEIDFLAGKGIRPDIAFFLNMYGCGSTNPEAFQKGIFYAVDKLKIKSVLPMHGADKEWVYGNLAEGAAAAKVDVQVGAAQNQGDRFFFRKGKLGR